MCKPDQAPRRRYSSPDNLNINGESVSFDTYRNGRASLLAWRNVAFTDMTKAVEEDDDDVFRSPRNSIEIDTSNRAVKNASPGEKCLSSSFKIEILQTGTWEL
eukprot:m.331726 g.331726  ORF g.331726 m.331726 type:complete len:103 (+) comp16788_c0_seq1:477-785(+)